MGHGFETQVSYGAASHSMGVLEWSRNNDLLSGCWLCLLDEAFTFNAHQRLSIARQVASDALPLDLQKILSTLPSGFDVYSHDRNPRVSGCLRSLKAIYRQ